MSKIVTPEKISEALSLYISKRVTKVGLTNSITEWLEQNPIEPVVVGLKFTPNWDDAPKNTHYARLQIEWLNKMNQQTGFSVLSKSERPHPMPQPMTQPEVKETVVRRSTHPFARSQQFTPHWANWVDKDGACFWHE